jgi:hypothetical protein
VLLLLGDVVLGRVVVITFVTVEILPSVPVTVCNRVEETTEREEVAELLVGVLFDVGAADEVALVEGMVVAFSVDDVDCSELEVALVLAMLLLVDSAEVEEVDGTVDEDEDWEVLLEVVIGGTVVSEVGGAVEEVEGVDEVVGSVDTLGTWSMV